MDDEDATCGVETDRGGVLLLGVAEAADLGEGEELRRAEDADRAALHGASIVSVMVPPGAPSAVTSHVILAM